MKKLEYENGLKCTIRVFKQHKNSVVQFKKNEFKVFTKLAVIVKTFKLDGSACVGLCRIWYDNNNNNLHDIPEEILTEIQSDLNSEIIEFIDKN